MLGLLRLEDLHVLVVACSGILVVSGNVDLSASADWDILVTGGVSCSDFWAFLRSFSKLLSVVLVDRTYGVKGNGDWAAWLLLFCLTGVVNDRLVVLERGQSLQAAESLDLRTS